MSDAYICQGCNAVGVNVSGAAAFCALNLMHISHCQTASLMTLMIPGQKTHPWASNCVLVMSWCDWCSVPRTFSLSDGEMMRASPWDLSPSSTVSDSQCYQKGHSGHVTYLMSSSQLEMMMSSRKCISSSFSKANWRAYFQTGDRPAWWMAISNAISGPGFNLKC